MAEVTPSSNILIMADGDTYSPQAKKIMIAGVRLVAGSAAATASIKDDDARVVYNLAAVTGTTDESMICTNVDSTSLTAVLAGTGASLIVYLK